MSLDSLRDRPAPDTQNEIATVILSRKRKLCELYAVATSTDPVPAAPQLPPSSLLRSPPFPSASASDPTPLTLFLNQNDLQQGRYFKESSLPARNYQAPTRIPASTSSITSPSEPILDGFLHRDSLDATRSSHPKPPVAGDKRDRDRRRSSTSSAETRPNQCDALSSQPEESPIRQPPSPHKKHDSPVKHVPEKVAKPTDDDADLITQKLRPPELQTTWADHTSSPSSTAGIPSNNTSRADAHSPDTSPDDDVSRDKFHDQTQSSQSTERAVQPSNGPRKTQASLAQPRQEELGQHEDEPVTPEPRPDSEHPDANQQGLTSKSMEVQENKADAPPTREAMDDDSGRCRTEHPQVAAHDQRELKSVPSENTKESQDARTEQEVASIQDQVIESPRPVRDRRPQRNGFRTIVDRKHQSLANAGTLGHTQTFAAVLKPRPSRLRLHALMRIVQKTGRLPNIRGLSSKKDYMHILFLRQAFEQQFKSDLSQLLMSSPKALTTGDWQANILEKQDSTIVKRVYEWQQNGRWTLRQLKPFPEPAIPVTHQDHLMSELRWLQKDFREERKQKLSIAWQLAEWCQDWVHASAVVRRKLQCKASGKSIAESFTLGMRVVTSDEDRTVVEEDSKNSAIALIGTSGSGSIHPPSGSASDQSMLNLDGVITWPEMVENLPTFEVSLPTDPSKALPTELAEDDYFQSDTVHPRRPDSQEGMEPQENKMTVVSTPNEPEDEDCALFDPESEALKKRLNAHGPFRFPLGPMPGSNFYEARKSSQWTPDDDHQLRSFVRDFPSNWELIADRMTTMARSSFTPNTQRRTPFECYERLIQLESQGTNSAERQLPGHAGQFQRGLEKIKWRYHNQNQMLQQAQGNNPQLPAPSMRAFPAPATVEKRPNRKFLGLVEAARKLARKREQALSRQSHSHHDSLQNQRNAQQSRREAPHPPQYFSKLKYERQIQDQRRQEQIRAHQMARIQQAQQAQQQRQHQSGNQPLYNSGLAQRMGNQIPGNSSTTTANGHLAVPANGHPRQPQASQQLQMGMHQGFATNSQIAQLATMNGRVPGTLSGSTRLPSYSTSASMNDQSVQQLVQQQQQQQQARQSASFAGQRAPNQGALTHGSPNMNSVPGLSNANAMGSMNSHLAGLADPRSPKDAHGSPTNMNAELAQQVSGSNLAQYHASNRQQSHAQPASLSSGHVPAIQALQHRIQSDNPNLSQDDVKIKAREQLNQMLELSRRNALNAATGGSHSSTAQQSTQQQQQAQQYQNSLAQLQYQNHSGGNQPSPLMHNGILASNNIARASSPNNSVAHQQNQQYLSRQMQQYNARNALMSPQTGHVAMASPVMTSGGMQPYPAGSNRTPTPGQHMPAGGSMGYAGMNMGMGQSDDHLTAMNGVAGSPRPQSSHDVP